MEIIDDSLSDEEPTNKYSSSQTDYLSDPEEVVSPSKLMPSTPPNKKKNVQQNKYTSDCLTDDQYVEFLNEQQSMNNTQLNEKPDQNQTDSIIENTPPLSDSQLAKLLQEEEEKDYIKFRESKKKKKT